MTVDRAPIDLLDDALSGSETDPRVAGLYEIGDGLRTTMAATPPGASGARALFVQGVTERSSVRRLPRVLVPAIAFGLVALVVATLSRTALPGTALYQVRKVLASVDLAPSAQHEVDGRIARARAELALARSELLVKPAAALDAANEALEQLGQARSFLYDVADGAHGKDLATIALLEERADSVIAQAHTEEQSHSPSGGSTPNTSRDGSGAGPARSDDSSHGDRSGSGHDTNGSSSDDSNTGSGSGGDDSGTSNDSSGDQSGSRSGGSDDAGTSGSGGDTNDTSGQGSNDTQNEGSSSSGDNAGNGSSQSSGDSTSGSGEDTSHLGGSSKGGGSTSDSLDD